MEPPAGIGSWTRQPAGSGPVASRPRGPATVPAASTGVVASTGTTASAPGGTGAPVAMRTAVPRRTSMSGAWPARTSPITSSGAGASSVAAATSAARIAYPSIAELSHGGRARGLTTGAAATRPRASNNDTDSVSVGPVTAANTRSRASSTLRSRSAVIVGRARSRRWPEVDRGSPLRRRGGSRCRS